MRGVFRPQRSGAAVAVGPLEGEILELLWDKGPKLSVPMVHRNLVEQGKSISYSAVKAVLNNLAAKDWLRKEKIGKVSHFEVQFSREDFEAYITRGVIASLKRNFGTPAIAQFIDQFAIDPEAITEFEKLLADKKKEFGQ